MSAISTPAVISASVNVILLSLFDSLTNVARSPDAGAGATSIWSPGVVISLEEPRFGTGVACWESSWAPGCIVRFGAPDKPGGTMPGGWGGMVDGLNGGGIPGGVLDG